MKKFSLIILGCLCLSFVCFGAYKLSNPPMAAYAANIEVCADSGTNSVKIEGENGNISTGNDDNCSAEEFDWATWFKEEALPVLVAVGSGIMTICAILVPVLKSVKGGIKLFKDSKGEYDKTTNEVLSAQKEINKTVENVQDLKKEVAELKIQVVNLVKIVKIAFTNNIELVKNGYANEILKIGDENGSKEIKETNSTTDNV